LISWVDVLRSLDQTIAKSKVLLAKSYRGPRPKGAGAASLFQLLPQTPVRGEQKKAGAINSNSRRTKLI